MKRCALRSALLAVALFGCSGTDSPPVDASAARDASSDSTAAMDDAGHARDHDAGVVDGGAGDAGCEAAPPLAPLVTVSIPFPSGARSYDVPPVEDSFNRAAPPRCTTFVDEYTPGPGECSVAQHDRYWVRARDGHIYRTWHPASEPSDVSTGLPCHYGHEHGDDPRTSELYTWAGGIAFGITNAAALAGSDHYHRHEDHYGHKVVVQDLWRAAVGNGPSDDPIYWAGFHCYWLSKVHQGTHSGDALGNNEHEYQNNIVCDDGPQRHPIPGWSGPSTAPDRHTEASVRTLTTWGGAAAFKACDGLTLIPVAGGVGRDPVSGSDTNREIKCANTDAGWMYRPLPVQITSETGDPNYDGSATNGIDELWKPWMTVRRRAADGGSDIFVSSAYYVVRNPARVYNPLPGATEGNGYIPRANWGGTPDVDPWIPTLEVCFDPLTAGMGVCAGLSPTLGAMPASERWRHPDSPFNGTIRVIHPKGTAMWNSSDRSFFCTDYRGFETEHDPVEDGRGYWACADGELLQFVAPTQNLWGVNATWGPDFRDGHVGTSMVNARSGGTIAPGYGHEWVRFFNDPTDRIHAPN